MKNIIRAATTVTTFIYAVHITAAFIVFAPHYSARHTTSTIKQQLNFKIYQQTSSTTTTNSNSSRRRTSPASLDSSENVRRCDEAYFEYSNACKSLRDATRALAKAEMNQISAQANAKAAEATLEIARKFVSLTEAKARATAEAASQAAFFVQSLQNGIYDVGERALAAYRIHAFANWTMMIQDDDEYQEQDLEESSLQALTLPSQTSFHKAVRISGELSTAAGIAATIAMTAASDLAAAEFAELHAKAHLQACIQIYNNAHLVYLKACEHEQRLLPHVTAACKGTNVMKEHSMSSQFPPAPLKFGSDTTCNAQTQTCLWGSSSSSSGTCSSVQELAAQKKSRHESKASGGGDLLTGPGMYYVNDPSMTVVRPVDVDATTRTRTQDWTTKDYATTALSPYDYFWREVEQLSAEDPNNPVILWQIVQESSSSSSSSSSSRSTSSQQRGQAKFIVMHRRKFLEQPLDGLTGASAETYAKNACTFPQSGTEPASPIHYRTDVKGWIDDVPGTYEYVGHDGHGEKSKRCYVNVKQVGKHPNATLMWRNRAGISWKLTPKAFPMLATGHDCPYFKEGYISCPIVRDFHGDVLYLVGPFGEQYMRVGD